MQNFICGLFSPHYPTIDCSITNRRLSKQADVYNDKHSCYVEFRTRKLIKIVIHACVPKLPPRDGVPLCKTIPKTIN